MRWSGEALEHSSDIAANAQRAAASDVGVAIRLLEAGFRGARLNVETNLRAMNDAVYGRRVVADVDRLAESMTTSMKAAETALAV